jgi:archaemetzincin
MKKIITLVVIALIFIAATTIIFKKWNSSKRLLIDADHKTVNAKPKKSKNITIVPLGINLSEGFVWGTYSEIIKYLPDIGIDSLTPLPRFAYYKPRGRYRADSLIKWMSRRAKPNQVFIGITNVDISTTKNHYQDWGIMGLGYSPGNAAVASNFRLKDKSAFWKVVIHELGHTAGLPHCPVKTCFMRDAKGGDPTSEENEFCKKCKTLLLQNGWKL